MEDRLKGSVSVYDQSITLSEDHASVLTEGSKIAGEVVNARGYSTIEWNVDNKTDKQRLIALNFPRRAVRGDEGSGILIPLYGANGGIVSYQWRPDEAVVGADGKKVKYFHPLNEASRIDIHPSNADRVKDTSIPLVITEGVKKADALTSQGQCVVALSGIWNWRNKLGTLGDWEDVPLKDRDIIILFDSDVRQNQAGLLSMQRLRNWLLSKGAKSIRYILVPMRFGEKEVKGVDDWFVAGGQWSTLLQTAVDNLSAFITPDAQFTDAMMAIRVRDEVLEGSFGWTTTNGWLRYEKGVWKVVDEAIPLEAVRGYATKEYAQALAEWKAGRTNDKSAVSGWNTMLSRSKLNAVLALSRGMDPIYMDFEQFDDNPDVLNTPSGLVDLSTGDLIEHDPMHMCMKQTNVDYVPGFKHPAWERALEAIPEEDVRAWAQTVYGQAVTGYRPPNDKLIIQQGGGANGKSTIMVGVSGALGSYFRLISTRVLVSGKDSGGEQPTEFMDFKGVRFALVEELPDARRLDVNKVKQSVGTPEITARPLYKNSVTFKTTHALFINTNYVPQVTETDNGSWRRLCLFDFPLRYRAEGEELEDENDRRGDENLRTQIENDPEVHKAVLAWLVDGAVAWYENNRRSVALPKRVQDDTKAWRLAQDIVMNYLSERTILDANAQIATRDVLVDMNEWLVSTGHRPWNIENVVTRILTHEEVIKKGSIEKKKIQTKSITNRGRGELDDLGARTWGLTGLRFRVKADEDDASGWDGE